MTDDTKLEAKKKLRAEALERRKAAFAQHGAEASRKIAAHGVDFLAATPGAIVSGFAAINDEINPAPLMTWLQAEGFRLALPVMQGRGKPLLMRAWTPGDAMNAAAWGIAEPMDDKPAVDPDILLVPLLAFDARGYRLGYGGGFYDRTLAARAALPASKPRVIGVGYGLAAIASIHPLPHDIPMDVVITEHGPQRPVTAVSGS